MKIEDRASGVRTGWSSKLNRFAPMMSPGIRSGVNWMRRNRAPRAREKPCASERLGCTGGLRAGYGHWKAGDQHQLDRLLLADDGARDLLPDCRRKRLERLKDTHPFFSFAMNTGLRGGQHGRPILGPFRRRRQIGEAAPRPLIYQDSYQVRHRAYAWGPRRSPPPAPEPAPHSACP